jgi:hypothetical protein
VTKPKAATIKPKPAKGPKSHPVVDVEPVLGASQQSQPMASTDLSRRVEKVVGYPPLSEMSAEQRRDFYEALLDADNIEDLPGKWQAAILEAERNRPKLRVISGEYG